MTASDSTRWSLIAGAAEGRESDRAEFARHYAPVIRSYLRARWRHFPLAADVDDAAQEVFLDCFKDGGALTRADPERSFRAFLYGVTRNVARRMEERWAGKREREHVAGGELLEDLAAREEPLSQVFDRAWALGMMAQAAELQGERARAKGGDAERRGRSRASGRSTRPGFTTSTRRRTTSSRPLCARWCVSTTTARRP